MPDGSYPGSIKTKDTFSTLEREKRFKNPPQAGHSVPILNEFVTPLLESFNALFDDSNLPKGDGDGRGLLSLGLRDIGERVVFDGKGEVGSVSGQRGWGNRLSCMYPRSWFTTTLLSDYYILVWYETVSVARPMVPEKDTRTKERRIFPSEASKAISL